LRLALGRALPLNIQRLQSILHARTSLRQALRQYSGARNSLFLG